MSYLDLAKECNRILLEADLDPLQGDRIQPTGFPDLGAATYTRPDGTEMLLVESTQSMANRLESVCWDSAKDDLVPELQGMPYVRVALSSKGTHKATCSILEFHRLNSPYIMNSDEGFRTVLTNEANLPDKSKKNEDTTPSDIPGAIDIGALAKACFRYDPGSVVHGVFLEKLDGRARLVRILSSFIEASDVRPADSGGVKLDRVNPSGPAQSGYGNVPFHRTEYVAGRITAFFSLDLSTLRGYGLGSEAEEFLITLSLWKIQRFLESGLRLRSACDLEARCLRTTRPEGLTIPATNELTVDLRSAIRNCTKTGLFASPPVTTLTWTSKAKKAKSSEPKGSASDKTANGGR